MQTALHSSLGVCPVCDTSTYLVNLNAHGPGSRRCPVAEPLVPAAAMAVGADAAVEQIPGAGPILLGVLSGWTDGWTGSKSPMWRGVSLNAWVT